MSVVEKKAPSWVWPVVGAVGCVALGSASGYFSMGGEKDWYPALAKPPGNPPPWVFGPVWTTLYILMGVAAGRLVNRKARAALVFFTVSFILNLAWSPVFFGARWLLAGFAVIAGMWAILAMAIHAAGKIDRVAAWLLLPYALWITYAGYLNAGIVWLNR